MISDCENMTWLDLGYNLQDINTKLGYVKQNVLMWGQQFLACVPQEACKKMIGLHGMCSNLTRTLNLARTLMVYIYTPGSAKISSSCGSPPSLKIFSISLLVKLS